MNRSISSSPGGMPVRSNDNLRISFSRFASGEGLILADSILANVKWSISFLGQLDCIGFGSVGLFTGANAQCSFHSAPSTIQRRINSFSLSERARFDSGGGINSSASLVIKRLYSSLASGLPGMMTAKLSSSLAIAPSCE